VDRQIERLRDAARAKGELDDAQRQIVAGIINAAILPVFPASADHLNPTFAFSPSTGFVPERVGRSIGDGCYQTLLALAERENAAPSAAGDGNGERVNQLTRALAAARATGKLKKLRPLPPDKSEALRSLPPDKSKTDATTDSSAYPCPFFEKVSSSGESEPVKCPFAESKDKPARNLIFRQCSADPKHGQPKKV
jgi:hypothetical protein